MPNKIKFELSQDEGMVLFEFLQELEEKKLVKRKAEENILWAIEAAIEKQSNFLLNNPKYEKQLEEARKKLSR